MAKSNRAYKSAKRTKELLRQKKKEEKLRRKQIREKSPQEEEAAVSSEGAPELQPPDPE